MKKEKKLSFIFTALILFIYSVVQAVPAIPTPVIFTQPNSKKVTVMKKGDERVHWQESIDGYTLVYNKEGYLTYAQLDDEGNLQFSDVVAVNIEERDMIITSFLNNIEKHLFYSETQIQMMLKIWQLENYAEQQNFFNSEKGAKGPLKTICAFVQFPEKLMIKTMSQFENLLNQVGYTGNGTGSVRDFFRQSSYNQFDLMITLCGIYTAPKAESYYAGTAPGDGTLHADELARWVAQQVAAEPNINFADFDSNNDGIVDGFHFIFAGVGQEGEGGAGTIWSHKSHFSPSVIKNGKSISVYSCSPELLYGSTITTIGVICHEMTHAFGAPDFYDTNYETGGQYHGTGVWDIMANGSWNGSPEGNCPSHHNMYTKIQFGWVTPTILNNPATISNMPNSTENPVTFRINTPTNNEYFLLENRQQVKFDASLPGSGLIIYHVSNNVGTSCINCTHPQRMYPVCASATAAVPTQIPSSYGNINTAGCPFPGSSSQTSFTDNTTPAMKSWANANTGKPITNIKNNNRLVSFDFMGGGCAIVTSMTVDYSENCSKASLSWNAPSKGGNSENNPPTQISTSGGHSKGMLWDNTAGQVTTGYHGTRWLGGTTNTRLVMADDFDVPSGEKWSIEEIYFYGFPSSSIPSPQPENIGFAIYKDNGSNRPQNTPLYEEIINANGANLTGNLWITFNQGLEINTSGKYWLSIYGAYNGAFNSNKQYYIGIATVAKAATMCRWDPENIYDNNTYYPNWMPNTESNYPSMAFSISGQKNGGGGGGDNQYNVYRDGTKIAGPISATSYEDVNFDKTKQHTWSVAVICSNGEGEKFNVSKTACALGIENESFENINIYSFSNQVYILNETNMPLKSVEILDMLGRLVYQNAITNTETVISLQVANGIYAVRLISQDETIIMKKVAIK